MKEYVARFGHGTAKLARQGKSKEKLLNLWVDAKRVKNFATADRLRERCLGIGVEGGLASAAWAVELAPACGANARRRDAAV